MPKDPLQQAPDQRVQPLAAAAKEGPLPKFGRGLSFFALAAGSLLALATCSNQYVEAVAKPSTAVDDHLTLHTKVCTAPPDPRNFPVKVLFIVDESGSMCVSDPPGAQAGQSGLCEQFCGLPNIQANPGAVPGCAATKPQPARVQALHQIIDQFRMQNAQFASNPPIRVAVAPFETNVFQNTWPGNQQYAAPDGPGGALDTYIDQLPTELGNGTDYQGVLDYAKTMMAGDIVASPQDEWPRTRYVVVFITDGTPYPRCTADNMLPNSQFANYDPFVHPELTWMDDPASYCQAGNNPSMGMNSPTQVNGYIKNTDRNQNYQLTKLVDDMVGLKNQFNIGDFNFDTILVLNPIAVQLCGLICQDLYGAYPGLNVSQFSQATFSVASWLLGQMSAHGNGVFQAFTNSQIQNISLGGLDYTSLASRNVMKSLFVQSLTSIPSAGGPASGDAGMQPQRIFDSDGDGLPDSLDNSFTYKTNPYQADSDGDCFDDLFEVTHKNQGFDPALPDLRGCQNGKCVCVDTDGDGLSQFAEAYLGTNPGILDSDADGVPDGLEVRYGFNPLVADDFAHQDTDGDGISDLDEFKANTDPTVPDAQLFSTDGYRYAITNVEQANGSVCYDVTISNLRMLPVPSNTNTDGYNLYKVWFGEAPESIENRDYGVWHVSCAWAQYQPPSFRVPEGPLVDMADGTHPWRTPDKLTQHADYLANCGGFHP